MKAKISGIGLIEESTQELKFTVTDSVPVNLIRYPVSDKVVVLVDGGSVINGA